MSDDDKNIMIGDLLVRSGLISSGDLTEAMAVSRRLGMPMGRVLTMDGRISPDIFQLALEAQSIIRDGLVPPDVGIEALAVAARDRQPIHEALKRMDRHPQAKGSTNRLGELLVDADIISLDQLNAALQVSVETGLPLGGTLVTQGIIHASLLPTVLRAQEQIRDGILPRDAAIEELKAAMKIWSKAEAAMKRTDYASEQPLKPSTVMSTLRDTLEGSQPQLQPPQPVPVHAPPQHQPSQLHAQLQQQQQQYYQNQVQHQQHPHPQPHAMQHQQTQPMQMPPQMPPQMPQAPMPQPMQQMPQQMPQPMQPPMPAPIYGYNTPYGHAPYGGPAPDDPWGSWHGSVPRHHGLGVPLPGFPQPPSMPPEGYAPPPGYPPQMPPQGAPPANWNMPAQNAPMPPQQMPHQPSSLHAQLQQQQMQQPQQMQQHVQPQPQQLQQQPLPTQPHSQPVAHAPVAPVPQQIAPPPPLPPAPEQPVPQVASEHRPQAEPAQQTVSAPPSPPSALPTAATAKSVVAEEGARDPGHLKNAAAQLASRLGWAAPKGAQEDAPADLPPPRKLSWGHPQPPSSEKELEVPQPVPTPMAEPVAPGPSKPDVQPVANPTPAADPAAARFSSPPPLPQPAFAQSTPVVPATPVIVENAPPVKAEAAQPQIADNKQAWTAPSSPSAAPVPSGSGSTPSSEFKNPFAAPTAPGASTDSPVGRIETPVQPEPDKEAFTSAPDIEDKKSVAASAVPSQDFQPLQAVEAKVELPAEKDLSELVKEVDEDDDDEPDFKMEFDLDLPAAFNKPVEQLRKEEDEKQEQLKQEQAGKEQQAQQEEEKQVSPPAADVHADKPMQKPVGIPISMPISLPTETGRPGQVAGFGKGTKISLKSDYAPNETGRLFAITPSEALTLLAEDDAEVLEDKKESAPAKGGKKGKSKASQSQNKLTKQQAKGKKGPAGKSQTGLQSIKEAEPQPAWMPQKNQTHPAALFGKKSGASSVPDFIEDLVPAAQAIVDINVPVGELKQVGPGGKASNTQSKMASIKQRAVSLSVSNLLPVPLEIAEAQAELAYIVEHRGTPSTLPVTYTPPPPLPPPPQADATIVELLTLSGFFSKRDIAAALDKALEDASMAPDLLMALGLVSDETLDVVVRCQGLTRSRYLTNEQAIYVLGAVRSGRLSFEEALVEIGK